MLELETKDIVFRPYVPEDRAFIDNSWATSYYSACRIKDLLSPEDFHFFHRRLRERFFLRPSATVIVAESDGLIVGWIAVEVLPNCTALHYIYVKSSYRREFGIAGALFTRALPLGAVVYTHFTPKAAKIMAANQERFRNFRFNPHLT